MLNEKTTTPSGQDGDWVEEICALANSNLRTGKMMGEGMQAILDRLRNARGDGWFIPDCHMTESAQETFCAMMRVISTGGSVDVCARKDAREYRWECDGLKYAIRTVIQPAPLADKGNV